MNTRQIIIQTIGAGAAIVGAIAFRNKAIELAEMMDETFTKKKPDSKLEQ